MASNLQLLKQVRKAGASILGRTDNPEFKALLASADVALNTLMLQQSPQFYLQLIAQGKALLEEGRNLLPAAHVSSAPHAVNSDPDLDTELLSLNRAFVDLVEGLDEARSAREKEFLVKVCSWEGSLYQHHLEQQAFAADETQGITTTTLQAYLRRRFPERKALTVTGFSTLDGGFSKKTILFETSDPLSGKESLVMRAEQAIDLLCYEGSDVTQEFYMIQLMRRAGLPIAEPLWLESDANELGARFIVSRKAQGKTYGGNLGSDEGLSENLVRSIVDTFIAMHNIRIDPSDPLAQRSHLREWLPHPTVREATLHGVQVFLPRLIRKTGLLPSPLLTRGLKWLLQNVPDCDEPPVVVHIDFALNNLIIDREHITAVLDWESSRLGDPAEDIIWTQQNLGAYLSLPEFLKLYEAGTGRTISAYRLAYARVFKCALNAITCLSAMRALDANDAAHIRLTVLAYRYMAIFGTEFNALIEAAEKARNDA